MSRSKSSFSASQHFHFQRLLKLRLETASNAASELRHQQVSGGNKLSKAETILSKRKIESKHLLPLQQ